MFVFKSTIFLIVSCLFSLHFSPFPLSSLILGYLNIFNIIIQIVYCCFYYISLYIFTGCSRDLQNIDLVFIVM